MEEARREEQFNLWGSGGSRSMGGRRNHERDTGSKAKDWFFWDGRKRFMPKTKSHGERREWRRRRNSGEEIREWKDLQVEEAESKERMSGRQDKASSNMGSGRVSI